MATGLLGGVLPYIYSRADALKRTLGDVVSNPMASTEQAVNNANDRARYLNQLNAQVASQGVKGLMSPQGQELARLYADAYNPVGMTAKSFKAPQQAALDLAQQRAALPVEQGGLGLPANNTAADRAKAMGFEAGWAHGSPNPDITNFIPSKIGAEGKGIYATSYLPEAGEYASQRTGSTVYPLMVNREKSLNVGLDSPYDILNVSNDDALLQALRQRGLNSITSTQQQTPDWLINAGAYEYPKREHFNSVVPENFRSRFAAFDPFRRTAATAAAMGVAAPDLLAQPVNQYQNPYETLPMYTDPFGNTIGSSIR